MYNIDDNEIAVVRVFIKKYFSEDENAEYYTIGWKDSMNGIMYGKFTTLTEIDGFTDAELIDAFNECMEEYEDFKDGNIEKYLINK